MSAVALRQGGVLGFCGPLRRQMVRSISYQNMVAQKEIRDADSPGVLAGRMINYAI